jgi:hypothetical protein
MALRQCIADLERLALIVLLLCTEEAAAFGLPHAAWRWVPI